MKNLFHPTMRTIKKFCELKLKEKVFETSYFLFDSLIDVYKDFQEERSSCKENEDYDFNPFYKSHTKIKNMEDFYEKIFINALKLILYLNVQESTIVVAFIFLDRIIKIDNKILVLESLEK